MNVLLVVLGALFLYLGGAALVKGAVRLARAWGISPLVVGLTVVAFGTSSPEFAATLIAAARGVPEMAFGNVVGSNIANLGLILGLTALIYPIGARARFIRREVPIMLAVSALIPVLVIDRYVGRAEGLLLLALLVPYLWMLLRSREAGGVEEEFVEEYGEAPVSVWRALGQVALGIGFLLLGANTLVEGAVAMARAFGIPERVIGITIVAFGTSLPELAAAMVAAVKRESDIVIGNLIGSNIFNVLGVLGATAALSPLRVVSSGTWVDLGVMLAFSLAVIPFLATGHKVARSEGAVLLGSYLVYVGYLYR